MKIKGETTIELTDVKTGKKERYHDKNMVTNAIAEYFKGCGFLNYPDIDKSNLVQLLLGGVMGFDQAITESAGTVHVPAGQKMTFNGSVGTSNNGEVTELGTYSPTESGWQDDGSYVQTYDYTTYQGNGTISCVCLTGQGYGYAGEGNTTSGLTLATKASMGLQGSVTGYTITGYPVAISIANSTAYGVSFEDIANGNVIIRKYRIPTRHINLKGTPSAPIVLEEQTISVPSALADYINGSHGNIGFVNGSAYMGSICTHGDKLYLFSFNHTYSPYGSTAWDSGYTQYMFVIDPVLGTITSEVLSNTTGVSLCGVALPVVLSDSKFIFIDGSISMATSAYGYMDASYIIKAEKVGGVWTMDRIENPFGSRQNTGTLTPPGWGYTVRKTTDRAIVMGNNGANSSMAMVYDDTLETVSVTDMYSAFGAHRGDTDMPLIKASCAPGSVALYRDPTYIATINNLATPVVKTAEKTMKVIYRLVFEEEETNA